jgi:hypothetical protein
MGRRQNEILNRTTELDYFTFVSKKLHSENKKTIMYA